MQVGHRIGLQAEIATGLDEGERVITHPDDAIEDDIRIEPWE